MTPHFRKCWHYHRRGGPVGVASVQPHCSMTSKRLRTNALDHSASEACFIAMTTTLHELVEHVTSSSLLSGCADLNPKAVEIQSLLHIILRHKEAEQHNRAEHYDYNWPLHDELVKNSTLISVWRSPAFSSSSHLTESYQATASNVTCAQRGYTCSEDCQTVYQCLGSSPNFQEITLERCDTENGYFCSSVLGKCSGTFSSTCPPPGYSFSCTSLGIFPDPYDCAAYHLCFGSSSDPQHSYQTCENGWLYDPAYNTCIIEAEKCLEDPVPTCTESGQAGPIGNNAAIYYVCEETTDGEYLYPVLFACPHGGRFNVTYSACV
uniref:Chitin-binding type-2 domain-containing protein n=1 Tax=Timema cristinae TaxID=61476 RepID=A0A7R9DD54_TIMCR|nr:unnamed protein product [Timema cristinae]